MRKSTMSTFFLAALLFSSSLIVPTMARAGDSRHRIDLNQRSASKALVGVSSPVLTRKGGTGAGAALRALAEGLGASTRCAVRWSAYDTERDGDSLFLRGSGWTLSVADNGQNMRFRTEQQDLPEVPENSKPSNVTVERWSRAFVLNELESVLPLGQEEEIVYLGAYYEMVISGSVDKKEPRATFVRQAVGVFGRRIGGIDVIGAGSLRWRSS